MHLSKLIHDKQIVVLAVSGLFAIADIAFNLHFSANQLEAGAAVVASYLLGSSYIAGKHAEAVKAPVDSTTTKPGA